MSCSIYFSLTAMFLTYQIFQHIFRCDVPKCVRVENRHGAKLSVVRECSGFNGDDIEDGVPDREKLDSESVERVTSSVESILSLAELCRFTTDFRL